LDKKELRTKLKNIRGAIVPADECEKIRNSFLQNVQLTASTVVATYIPFQSELNIDKLNRALGYAGYKLCLPAIQDGGTLAFREWNIYTELAPNKFGIPEPKEGLEDITPDIIIMPMLGFNKAKYRLGYGGGYYDRTIINYPQALKVGVAYAAQEIAEDFQQPHDVALNLIITENMVYR
jgi:5-formyltetrahydrofolate cyclo-ligase